MIRRYRTDIDGLRAIAIISVVLFHLGYLSNGYLGVDIFFVISGYLITGIAYGEVEINSFSVASFYERRIRRIVPLVLFTTLTAFLLGLLYMLPNDLENLSQSVFASNVLANNILLRITSADYWAVTNDYKPLMHTWSLGVEEQFYLFYPIIFSLLRGDRKKYILPVLICLTALSLALFLYSNDRSSKFYFLQYRFFELSIGGICAIHLSNNDRLLYFKKQQNLLFLILMFLLLVLAFNSIRSNELKIIITTILTAGALVLGESHFQTNPLYKTLLSNKIFTGIGKISFSIYMWHQIVFAFARYRLVDTITIRDAAYLSMVILILSSITYFTIEKPFRDKSVIRTRPLLIVVGSCWAIIICASLYVYMIGGIIKDVPELGLEKSSPPSRLNIFSSKSNIHIQYNEDVRALDKPFSENAYKLGTDTGKIRILVIGNSFGRDVANVLLESSFSDAIEVRYADLASKPDDELIQRIEHADYIFFGSNYPNRQLKEKLRLDMSKVWIVGTKDFGASNGRHYNRTIENYSTYRTAMKDGVLERNLRLRKEWGKRYIDLVELTADSKGRVLVFTPDGKFISQDAAHFTKSGAMFFARLLDGKFRQILKIK